MKIESTLYAGFGEKFDVRAGSGMVGTTVPVNFGKDRMVTEARITKVIVAANGRKMEITYELPARPDVQSKLVRVQAALKLPSTDAALVKALDFIIRELNIQ
jgi:hypothetical protein